MKRLLKFFGWILALLLGATVALVLTLIFIPGALINQTTVEFAVDVLRDQGINIRAKTWSVDVSSQSWREKAFTLQAKNLAYNSDGVDVTGDTIDIELGIDLVGNPTIITDIGPVDAQGVALSLRQQEESQDAEPSRLSLQQIIEKLKPIRIHPIKLQNFRFESESVDKHISRATVDLDVTRNTDGTVDLQATLREAENLPIEDLTLSAQAGSLEAKVPDLALALKASLAAGGSVDFDASLSASQQNDNLNVQLQYRKNRQRIDLDIAGQIQGDQTFALRPDLTIQNVAAGLDSLKVRKCRFSGKFETTTDGSLRIDDCRIDLVRGAFEGEDQMLLMPPKQIRLFVDGNYRYDPREEWDRFRTQTEIRLQPIASEFHAIDGKFQLDLDGRWSEPDKIKAKSDLDMKLAITDYQKMRRQLARTDWSIPAPFHQMDGTLRCHALGTINTARRRASVPIKCFVDLRGGGTKLVSNSHGKFLLREIKSGYQPSIELAVEVNEAALHLPHVRLTEKPPRFTADSRIRDEINFAKPKRPKKEKTLPLEYNITISTPDKPIQIANHETPEPIPISLDLAISSGQSPAGAINIGRFVIPAGQKEAIIDHFNMVFHADGEPTDIDGLLKVEKTDMDLLVNMYGSFKEPRYKITSDPPRAQSEVMANLMYGESSGQLSTGNQQSVAETQAALADGAIGIISMFYLASTPVESVGYNPHTRIFHASLKVRDDVTLTMGTGDEGARQVGLSKRLWGNWSFDTFAVKPTADEESRGIAMLKWANRY